MRPSTGTASPASRPIPTVSGRDGSSGRWAGRRDSGPPQACPRLPARRRSSWSRFSDATRSSVADKRELGTLVPECAKYDRTVHRVAGLGVSPGHWAHTEPVPHGERAVQHEIRVGLRVTPRCRPARPPTQPIKKEGTASSPQTDGPPPYRSGSGGSCRMWSSSGLIHCWRVYPPGCRGLIAVTPHRT